MILCSRMQQEAISGSMGREVSILQHQNGTMGCKLKWLGSDVGDADVTGSVHSGAN